MDALVHLVFILIMVAVMVWGVQKLQLIAEPFKTIIIVVIVVAACLYSLAKLAHPLTQALRSL